MTRSRSRSRAASRPSLPSNRAFVPIMKTTRQTCSHTCSRCASRSATGPQDRISAARSSDIQQVLDFLSGAEILPAAREFRDARHVGEADEFAGDRIADAGLAHSFYRGAYHGLGYVTCATAMARALSLRAREGSGGAPAGDARSVVVIAVCLQKALRRASLTCKYLLKLVAGEGFEPPTLGL